MLDRWPLPRLEALIRATSLACALVVVAATAMHALQLREAIEAAAEARLLTVSRILAKEVNRTLLQTQGLLEQVDDALHADGGAPRGRALETLLESLPRQQTLLREIAVLDADGRIAAGSDRRRVGTDLSALDFARVAADDGRVHVGVPKSGRGPAASATEGPEHASTGWITLSRPTGGVPGRARVVAVIGADSLIGDLQFVSSDAELDYALYRYDGALLAASDPSAATRRTPHPIFSVFLPDRETGAFEDRPDGARHWMAHFDTTADFPVVVEVRLPRSTVLARWESELVAPALILLVTLGALLLYTRLASRALRQRARSERQAATQERRLRNIVDTAADGIVTVDTRGVVREYNRAAESIFGVAARDAIGRPLATLLPDEDPARAATALERWRDAQTGFDADGRTRTVRTRRRDGHRIELQFAVSEVADQGELLYTGIVRDVTRMRQAEERFRTLFERSGEPHLLFDRDGLVDCNDAAATLLRAAGRDALLGRRLEDLAPAAQAQGPSAQVLASAVAQARTDGSQRLVWTARALDGADVPVEMTLTPIRLGDQDATLVAWHDIAERQRYEQGLREARDAAESAAAAKARFLATMSHELRTPMTGILGMTELLHETRLDDGQRRIVEVLDGSARSLLTVLNDVLDYSKIEAGALRLESIDFRPDAVVREVASLLAAPAAERGNAIAVRWPDGPAPALRGDPTRLRQVLLNLVGNAIKFTEHGSITVTGGARPLADGRVALELVVADSGIGIDPEVLPTLFQPFRQADPSTTRRFGGTGLGLAICRHLVEAMGGAIEADSRPGHGSTFRVAVRLDRAGAATVAAAAAPAPDGPQARGLRILVAEDNPTNRLVVGTRLGRAMHRVDLVENGLQALEAVRERDYDLVLMDMQMPELDGCDATRAIRALPGPRSRTPIVALTADALPEFRERHMDCGLDDYLTKPVDWRALERVLRRFAPPAAVEEAPAGARPDSTSVDATRANLGEEAWRTATAIFWPRARAELDACEAAVANGDAPARRTAAHSLRGASASLGLERVSALCAALERCDDAQAPEALAALRRELATARAAWAPAGTADG